MKILFLSSASGFFVANYLDLVAACRRFGEVHVAVVLAAEEHKARLEAIGCTVHPLALTRNTLNPIRLLGEIASLRRLYRRLAPDVTIPLTIKVVFAAVLANLGRPGGRLLGIVTGLGYLFTGGGIKRRLARFGVVRALSLALRRMPHLLLFSNEDDREEFLRLGISGAESSRVLPVPGVDTARFRPSPEPDGPFRVVLPARMLREKGVGEFVAAAERLRGEMSGAEFLLAGGLDPANPAAIAEETIRGWVAAGGVVWLGHVDDMPALLASCHVVCLPSHREGFPVALVESMASERAFVATDVPGCREAARGSGAGLLVPVRDEAALAAALLRLFRNPGERARLGRLGRDYVELNLSREIVAAGFAEMLDAFVARARR